MPPVTDISERAFEAAIECALLANGPDACAGEAPPVQERSPRYGDAPPGGYHKRSTADYDQQLCLLSRDLLDFVLATQAKTWSTFQQHHGAAANERFLRRVSAEIERRGTLDVMRQGVKDSGCKFHLAWFRPASGLNADTRRLFDANQFSIVRQLRYTEKPEARIADLVLFLNGIPLFTAELKNPLNGQTVDDAIREYKDPTKRDPRDPLLSYGRCLAHFAVDPELVFVTTRLEGARTRFLPFNQGRFGGAGNPPVPPTRAGFATAYLWEDTWSRDTVLELVRRYVQDIEEEDADGRKTGVRYTVFPRWHQLECVRRLIADARTRGTGHRYLVQHSAGSGKSFTIGWLAHQLSSLHDALDHRVFDSIVVVTDRRVLDRQLQTTMRQLEQTLGVVENIDTTSRKLRDALESGKTIIVTTLQKFPVIAREIGELPGRRFAVIVDEAHSSQSGESTRSLKAVLSATSLDSAEAEEEAAPTPEEELESTVLAEVAARGPSPNLSLFAFTATPKEKTLELFGTRQQDGTFQPFHRYTMRQAIEEGFIHDVLRNYTTYTAYWRLLKRVEDDPRYDKAKAAYLLKSFVELHAHAITQKVKVCVEHFATNTQHEIGGRAKAMIVTRSRLHAVRYKRAVDAYLTERGYPFKALVAFSGVVQDGGQTYTEAGMNGFPDTQTARTFAQAPFRFLIVANKFQTGFDQPLLHTMYVDKKLGGVNAVQTLSRLNRTHAAKRETAVLDFANETAEIQAAFAPYYETTLLSEGTDPNLLYEMQTRLAQFPVFTESEVNAFAAVYFDGKSGQDRLYALLAAPRSRALALPEEERTRFRGHLGEFNRLYAFLAQILPFRDADLEKLHVFARYLRRLLPAERDALPVEVQQAIDMESYRLQETASGRIVLDRRPGVLDPQGTKESAPDKGEEQETLSRIIAELNERFGLNLGPEHRVTLTQMMERLDGDPALDAASRVNSRENVRLTFDQKVEQVIQEIVDSNFELYKRITDDRVFGEVLKNELFEAYVRLREKHHEGQRA